MEEPELRKKYTLPEIIEIAIENKGNFNDVCLYTKNYTTFATVELVCYLDHYPKIKDDDTEVYPGFVVENSLELFFYGQQFEDVIASIENQNKEASIDDYIKALNFYFENDAFIIKNLR